MLNGLPPEPLPPLPCWQLAPKMIFVFQRFLKRRRLARSLLDPAVAVHQRPQLIHGPNFVRMRQDLFRTEHVLQRAAAFRRRRRRLRVC